jgi:sugar lactone lactonase YvrE
MVTASAAMAPAKQQIRTSAPRSVFDTRFKLGESPIWDAATQRLLWVDQEGKRIHWFYPADGRQGSVPTQELTPAIILTQQSPDILVVPMEQVSSLHADAH